jgi:long-subunit fatty acid transport protein
MLGVLGQLHAGVTASGLGAGAHAVRALALRVARTALIAATAVVPVLARVDTVFATEQEAGGTARHGRLAAAAIADLSSSARYAASSAVFGARRELRTALSAGDRPIDAAFPPDRRQRDLGVVGGRAARGEGSGAGDNTDEREPDTA